jgi:endonuclease YncB( thermonuclease family)
MWDRRAKYVSNHDGDTVTMLLDQGFRDNKEITVRLLGVFAPELSQTGGKDCQDYVEGWFYKFNHVTWPFIVTTARMKVADKEQMTLDRYVGTITTLDGSNNLNVDVQAYITRNGYSGGVGS